MTLEEKAEEKEVQVAQAQRDLKQNPKAKEVETHLSQFGDNLTDPQESRQLLVINLHQFASDAENEVT